ncbi:hxnY [Symbiodinium natans]|uniref:HxnY protein n=1 Tax=Symbiodinium natans TaxID=878477 RepID=A0A812P861_9DINO|nr:hxnY [Symbiodinium natans]
MCLFAYSPAWVRQEENMYLTTPPEVAVKLPPVVQELIGYSLHGQVLGMVDVNGDMGDPQEKFHSTNATLPVLSRREMQCSDTRKAFAASLRSACEHSGFLYLVDHGLDKELETAQRALRRFFEQPHEVKAKLGTAASRVFPQHSRGYVANETLDPSRQGQLDLKESLEVGLERPEESDPRARPFRGPNNWPSEVPELEQDFMAAVHALHELSMELLGALEECLEVEPGSLAKLCDDPMVLCRGLHYYTPLGAEARRTWG